MRIRLVGCLVPLVLAFPIVCLAQASNASSSSPREQLKQYVADLRRNPSDDALREKIIKLALQVIPPPAIPEEANRHFVKGGIFLKEAKAKADYDLAVSEFRHALLIAPWWGDAYYNLGVALESAEDFDGAAIQFKIYLLTNPGEKEAAEARSRIYAIEARKELAATRAAEQREAAAQDAKQRADAARRKAESFEGDWYWRKDDGSYAKAYSINRVPTGQYIVAAALDSQTHDAAVDGSTIKWSEDWGMADRVKRLTLSDDGSSLSGTDTWQFPNPKQQVQNQANHDRFDMNLPNRPFDLTLYRR